MKSKTLALAVAFALALPFLAQAKTLKFPKEDPEFSVTFADDWTAEITDSGIITAQPKGAAYSVSIFPVAAKTAADAVQETLKEVAARFSDVKASKPSEFKTANGIQFTEGDYTAKDKGADRALAILAFSPGGKRYYALFQAGTPEADKEYTPAIVTAVKSIKAIKASDDD
ncbi:MAG: hypothetical protein QOC70_1245 [Verrucomicrobiota bacterium]|jgi:hypothetical protein